jgi:uncharacterized protein (UPF0218 family)
MPLTPEILAALKKPFGALIPDAQMTKGRVASAIKGTKKVITVGDATTERLLGFGIVPDIAVIDGKERRSGRDYPGNYVAKEMQCANPAGAISKHAIESLKAAIASKQPVRVVVDGEEDLLALPMFAMAPDGAAVLYGQPLEGLVVVKITPAKRRQAKDLMQRIGVEK